MPVTIKWDNDDKTILRLIATDPWNWNDFHKNMRIATFWLDTVKHPVEIVVDLTSSTHTPAGAIGHVRSLGTKIHANTRPRLLVIGLDESLVAPLTAQSGKYETADRLVCFVADEPAAQAQISAWQTD